MRELQNSAGPVKYVQVPEFLYGHYTVYTGSMCYHFEGNQTVVTRKGRSIQRFTQRFTASSLSDAREPFLPNVEVKELHRPLHFNQ